MPTPLRVVCAVILNDKKNFLACQRGDSHAMAGKWEFPGGKIEANESPRSALIREIREELQIDVSPMKKLTTVMHDYPTFTIELIPFICSTPIPCIPHLTEHKAFRWITIQESSTLDWADADIPILGDVEDFLKNLV